MAKRSRRPCRRNNGCGLNVNFAGSRVRPWLGITTRFVAIVAGLIGRLSQSWMGDYYFSVGRVNGQVNRIPGANRRRGNKTNNKTQPIAGRDRRFAGVRLISRAVRCTRKKQKAESRNMKTAVQHHRENGLAIAPDFDQSLVTSAATLSAGEKSELAALEQRIEVGLQTFMEVGMALGKIRKSRLYRDTHETFEKYVEARWGKSVREAHRLIAAADVCQNLLPKDAESLSDQLVTLPLPTSESQVRPLAGLSAEEQREIWGQASERAGGQAPTAKLVESVIEERKWPKPNGLGVYHSINTERLQFKDDDHCSAAINLLQIGKEDWISCTEFQCWGYGMKGVLKAENDDSIYGDRDTALWPACVELRQRLAHIIKDLDRPAGQRKSATRIADWTYTLLPETEQQLRAEGKWEKAEPDQNHRGAKSTETDQTTETRRDAERKAKWPQPEHGVYADHLADRILFPGSKPNARAEIKVLQIGVNGWCSAIEWMLARTGATDPLNAHGKTYGTRIGAVKFAAIDLVRAMNEALADRNATLTDRKMAKRIRDWAQSYTDGVGPNAETLKAETLKDHIVHANGKHGADTDRPQPMPGCGGVQISNYNFQAAEAGTPNGLATETADVELEQHILDATVQLRYAKKRFGELSQKPSDRTQASWLHFCELARELFKQWNKRIETLLKREEPLARKGSLRQLRKIWPPKGKNRTNGTNGRHGTNRTDGTNGSFLVWSKGKSGRLYWAGSRGYVADSRKALRYKLKSSARTCALMHAGKVIAETSM